MFSMIKVCFSILISICSLTCLNFSQPQGNEGERVKELAYKVQKKIEKLNGLIKENPTDSELYSKRGYLRIKILEILYGGSYLSVFYQNDIKMFRIDKLTSKGIEDFNKAIKLSKRADYYAGRGKLYSSRWYAGIRKSGWHKEMQKLTPEKNRDRLLLAEKQKEIILFEKFYQKKDFFKAEADFDKALKLDGKFELADQIRQELAKLYFERSQLFASNMRRAKKMLVKENKFGYSIIEDIDKSIYHVSKIKNFDAETQKTNKSHYSKSRYYHRFDNLHFSPVQLYLRKAYYADSFDYYGLVVQALEIAENHFDKFPLTTSIRCGFYSLRSNAYNKMNKFNRAIQDVEQNNILPKNPNFSCDESHLQRGDALQGLARYKEAIEEYTILIEKKRNYTREKYLGYKNRGFAHFNLGNFAEAIKDFDNSMKNLSSDYSLKNYGNWDSMRIDLLNLKAKVYKQTNNQEKLLATQKRIKRIQWRITKLKVQRIVFGEVVDRNGNSIKNHDVFVSLTFSKPVNYSSPFKKQKRTGFVSSHGINEFVYKSLPNTSFRISAYIEVEIDGKKFRLFGRTKLLKIKGKILGPIKLKLDRKTERTNRKNNPKE